MTLKELEIGKNAVIESVGGKGSLRQHLLDMGIIPGANVKMIRSAPMGDPLEIRIHDYELTLRADDAGRITVKPARDSGTEGTGLRPIARSPFVLDEELPPA